MTSDLIPVDGNPSPYEEAGIYSSALEVYKDSNSDSHKESTGPARGSGDGKEVVQPFTNPTTLGAGKFTTKKSICGLRSTQFWWLLGILVIIIVAAVGASVGATRHSQSHSTTSPSRTSTSIGLSSTPTTTPKGIQSNSSIAAVAYNDSNNVMQYQVYYQDENNMIKESAWDKNGSLWYVSNKEIGEGKAGSPIAAAATGPPD